MNQYLYLLLNLGSLSIPLFYSIFEKKFHFIQYFKQALISIVLVAIPFLIWDGFFTANGVWGFNDVYFLGAKIFGMPIEEWLFFLCIPYACLFTHEVLKYLFPKFKLSKKITFIISLLLVLVSIIILIFNFGKLYTTINFIFFLALLFFGIKYKLSTLQEYFPSFLVILIPFFNCKWNFNRYSFIDEPVVWYNDDENIGFRLFTIPIEDVFYAFNLLFSIQLIFNVLKNKKYESK